MTPPDAADDVVRAARDVAAARARVTEALRSVERDVRRSLDWRRPIRRDPLLFTLAAGLLGYAVGRALGRCRGGG